MPRYEPWEDHELAILYEHLRIRWAGNILAPYMPGRTPKQINDKLWKLRGSARIRALPPKVIHRSAHRKFPTQRLTKDINLGE